MVTFCFFELRHRLILSLYHWPSFILPFPCALVTLSIFFETKSVFLHVYPVDDAIQFILFVVLSVIMETCYTFRMLNIAEDYHWTFGIRSYALLLI